MSDNSATPLISKTVLLLGLISLFTDMASEMVYPILPLYMESIGISVIGIGVLEGIAQATAGLSKGYFGRWSDISARRLPFVQIGYGLSAMSKPLLAFATSGWTLLASRFGDRLGKGIRTGARDALLSQEANSENRGRIFGFHRAMDSFGAALGPLMALAFLWYYPEEYKALFLLAIIPGLFAIISTYLIKEPRSKNVINPSKKPKWNELIIYLKSSSKGYKKLVLGLLLFSLINSTDLFLLLFLKTIGYGDIQIISIYILYNLIFALTAYPAGILGDRFSLRQVFLVGLLLFSITYIGLGSINNITLIHIVLLFTLYGLFAACTEGVSKAWITQEVDGINVGSAIGNFEALNSITTMLASAIGGMIWYQFGAQVLFIATGLFAIFVLLYLKKIKSS